MKREIRIVRGTIVSLVLALPLVFFGVNALYAFAANVLAGWLPSKWFSSAPVDWLFSDGRAGGAKNYFLFMVNGIPAYLCCLAIRWGFTGKAGD